MKFTQKTQGIYELDVKGYVCPYPQLYTIKIFEKLQLGDVLDVIFDNPSSLETISCACDANGIKILEKAQPAAGIFKLRLQK